MAMSRSSHSPISFDSPYGDSGLVGVSSVTMSTSGVPNVAALEENTILSTPVSAIALEHADRTGHVLVVRVQRPRDRDAGVLEPGHVDDPVDLVLAQRVERADRVSRIVPCTNGHVVRDEAP